MVRTTRIYRRQVIISKCPRWLLLLLIVAGCASCATYKETTSNGTFVVTRMNNGQPIITEAMFQALGASDREGENMSGPSVIRIPDWITPADRAHPAAVYYLYFAHHSGKYVRMASAANISGPWTLYDVSSDVEIGDRGVLDLGGKPMPIGNGIVLADNHLASPDVHVDDGNQRVIMYFHSGSRTKVNEEQIQGQKTFVATSHDGLNFTGNVEPVILGGSYFSVFEYAGNVYALDNGANLYKAPDSENPWSSSPGWNFADDFWQRAQTNAYQSDIDDDGYTFAELRVRHVNTWLKDDTLYAFYSRRGADAPERIMLSVTDLKASNDHNQWDPSYPPEEIYRAQPGWEGGHFDVLPSGKGSAPEDVNQIRDPYLFEDRDGELYVIYTAAGEDALGLLHLEPVNSVQGR